RHDRWPTAATLAQSGIFHREWRPGGDALDNERFNFHTGIVDKRTVGQDADAVRGRLWKGQLCPRTEYNTLTGATRQQVDDTILDPEYGFLPQVAAKLHHFLGRLADHTEARLLMGQVWRTASDGKEHASRDLQLPTQFLCGCCVPNL